MKRNLLFLPLLPLAVSGYFLLEYGVTTRRVATATVMIGDEHVARFPAGKLPVTFLGYPGATLESILPVVDSVAATHPKKIWLEVGLNDLKDGTPTDTVFRRYRWLLERIKTISPATTIYVQSVLPTAANEVVNKRVKALNDSLMRLPTQYVDYWPFFVSKGRLNPYFAEGDYLIEDAYQRWKWKMRRYMK